MTTIANFSHNGITVFLEDDFISLTRLWEMSGSPQEQRPNDWKVLPETDKLITQMLAEQGLQNTEKSGIIKSKRGRGGGTFAHWKLALDYAGYLSPALKSKFYDWIKERIEEESNPDLAYERGRDRAVRKWKQQGKDDKWIQQRLDGIENRIEFTDTLREHGVNKPFQFGVCTNKIYEPVLGGTAKEIKEQRSLVRVRDGLSQVELMAVGLAEALASEKMKKEQARGFKPCRDACEDSGNRVARVFV
jgi:hypothetical protein